MKEKGHGRSDSPCALGGVVQEAAVTTRMRFGQQVMLQLLGYVARPCSHSASHKHQDAGDREPGPAVSQKHVWVLILSVQYRQKGEEKENFWANHPI